MRRQKKVHIKVPAGIDNGQAISVRGQGDMGRNGGPAGDLIVGINVMPHASSRREGSHIYLDQAVSVYQAAMGGEIEIPSLDGKIKCKVEPGTQPGTTLRLRGKGVPRPQRPRPGDQYVTIRVEIPRNLNEAKEALRKFAETMGEVAPSSSEEGESKSVFHRRKRSNGPGRERISPCFLQIATPIPGSLRTATPPWWRWPKPPGSTAWT